MKLLSGLFLIIVVAMNAAAAHQSQNGNQSRNKRSEGGEISADPARNEQNVDEMAANHQSYADSTQECGVDEILQLESNLVSRIYMQCMVPEVCGKQPICKYSQKTMCLGQNEFVAGVTYVSGLIRCVCCDLSPMPAEFSTFTCQTFVVADGEPAFVEPYNPKSEGGGSSGGVGAGPQQEQFIKGVVKTGESITVIVCQPVCKSTTTSTTTTTTKTSTASGSTATSATSTGTTVTATTGTITPRRHRHHHHHPTTGAPTPQNPPTNSVTHPDSPTPPTPTPKSDKSGSGSASSEEMPLAPPQSKAVETPKVEKPETPAKKPETEKPAAQPAPNPVVEHPKDRASEHKSTETAAAPPPHHASTSAEHNAAPNVAVVAPKQASGSKERHEHAKETPPAEKANPPAAPANGESGGKSKDASESAGSSKEENSDEASGSDEAKDNGKHAPEVMPVHTDPIKQSTSDTAAKPSDDGHDTPAAKSGESAGSSEGSVSGESHEANNKSPENVGVPGSPEKKQDTARTPADAKDNKGRPNEAPRDNGKPDKDNHRKGSRGSNEKQNAPDEAGGDTNPHAAPGGGGGPCFSGDTIVQSTRGRIRMDEVQIGDQVLTAISTGSGIAAGFSPVRWFVHRRPEELAEFITITTAATSLKITPNHLLPVVPCESARGYSLLRYLAASVPAQEAKPGSCLLVHSNGGFQMEPILAISSVIQRGIYSPITSVGNVVVGDVLASCYTGSNHQVRHAAFKVLEYLIDTFAYVAESLRLIGGFDVIGRADGEIPLLLHFLLSAQNALASA